MRKPLDDIIVFDGNKAAFERIIGIVNEQKPSRLFLYGPSGSGKTAVLSAREKQKDEDPSAENVMFTHAPELIAAIRLDSNESLLVDAGSVGILLVDEFDSFFDDEIGLEVCRLLLNERDRLGLSTVLAARKPLSSYDLSTLEGALDDFEELEAKPLDAEGRKQFARAMQKRYRGEADDAVALSDEAIEFVSIEFADNLSDVDVAIRYLITAAGFGKGDVISADQAKSLLTP